MKIELIYIGKTKKSFLVDGENEYNKRLKKYLSLKIIEIPDVKNQKNRSKSEIKSLEGKLLLNKLKKQDYVILLDERGKEFTSSNFAKSLQKLFNTGHQKIVFIIGGAYGFSDEIYQRSNSKLALSKMTFSHQMIRLFFVEQLYRAMTILKGESYHHE